MMKEKRLIKKLYPLMLELKSKLVAIDEELEQNRNRIYIRYVSLYMIKGEDNG